jgi:glycosyltransferase involved in cell wall biosynthesis
MCGNLTAQQTGELYRTCDVGIALSATNLSYLPVELMACGVPVLTNDGPNVEWFCKDHDNSLVCKPFPSVFIAALQQLIDSPQLRLKLINGGLTTIAQTSWEKEADGILKSIYERLHFPQLIIQ